MRRLLATSIVLAWLCAPAHDARAQQSAPMAPPPMAPPPQQPPGPLPPPTWTPQPLPAWAPPPPAYGPVIVMPPGFLEWPGRWPRRVAVDGDAGPPPLGYHHATEPPKPLWIAGTTIFAAVGGVTALVAGGLLAGSGDAEHALLFLPVIGPLVWIPAHDESENPGAVGVMVVVAAAQGAGLGLLISGLSMRRPIHLRNDVSALDPRASVRLGPAGATFGLEF